jgi:glycosyltransferase involved in cell wall biosynthesis
MSSSTSSLGPPLEPDTPVVVFGDDWGRNVSTMQHLFRHLTREYPIIWVNAIGHRVPEFSRRDFARIAQKARALAGGQRRTSEQSPDAAPSAAPSAEPDGSVAAPLRVIQPRVLPWHHRSPVRAFNRRSLVRAIRQALDECGLTRAPLLVTGSPPSVSVMGHLGEYGSAYLCMDDFLHLPNVSHQMIAPLERELLSRVDIVIATAKALVDLKRPSSGQAFHLPQGVNFAHFSAPRPVPAELAALPRPIIGFAGTLATPPIDIDLLLRVADANPTASIVLVGPVSWDESTIRRPNVHILGHRPYPLLPAYVQAFDVGLIPYALSDYTRAVDPLKLLEYLAAGVPVVSTDLPEAHKYREQVAICPDSDSFIDAIARACRAGPGSAAPRRTFAKEHGWESRAEVLKRLLGGIGKGAAAPRNR